jgi:hypothetical protein
MNPVPIYADYSKDDDFYLQQKNGTLVPLHLKIILTCSHVAYELARRNDYGPAHESPDVDSLELVGHIYAGGTCVFGGRG